MHRARWHRKRSNHTCGYSYEACGDPEHEFFVQRHVCHAEMEQAAYEARYDDHYGGMFHDGTFQQWSTDRSSRHPYGHRDGVTFYVAETDDESATWHLPPRRVGDKAYVTPSDNKT